MKPQDFIPQLFFDIISRVLPGAVFFSCVTLALGIAPGSVATELFSGAKALQESVLVLSCTFLGGFYLLGQLLAPLSDWYEKHLLAAIFPRFSCILKRMLDRSHSEYPEQVRLFYQKDLYDRSEQAANPMTDPQLHSALFVRYDWVRAEDPELGARLAKIRAEYRMYSAIAVGAVLLIAVHLTAAELGMVTLSIAKVLLAVLLFLSTTWCTVRTKAIFQKSVLNNYFVLKTKPAVRKPKTPVKDAEK